MKYGFELNNAGYPLCIVEAPYALFGQFLSFEMVPTRIKEIEAAIEKSRSSSSGEIEIERDDAVLTIFSCGEVELDIWTEGEDGGDSIETTLSDFEQLFVDWKAFLEDEWDGYRC